MTKHTTKFNWPLAACVAVQVTGLALFGFQFFVTVFETSLRTSWAFQELAEISAFLALLIGTIASTALLYRGKRRERRMQSQLDAASHRFQQVIEEQFLQWGFTAAEVEIGVLMIKGLSIAEIAELRRRSPATIKAQNSSIYQKSGLANRAQLVSYFVEELTSGF